MKLAIIQMKVCADKQKNILRAGEFIAKAAADGADLAVLPEMFSCPYDTALFGEYAEPEGGKSFAAMSEYAKNNKIWLAAGTMPELAAKGGVYNTLYMYGRDGRLAGKHRKLHLFDIDIKDGQYFRESDTLSAGESITVLETELGKIGLAICYDIRFPEMFCQMALRGAKLIVVPAAFNLTTGPKHWELLFRARALDSQAFIAGVAAARDTKAGYVSYAHSILTNPWGEVVLQMGENENIAVCDVNFEEADIAREQLPIIRQRRPDVYEKYYSQ